MPRKHSMANIHDRCCRIERRKKKWYGAHYAATACGKACCTVCTRPFARSTSPHTHHIGQRALQPVCGSSVRPLPRCQQNLVKIRPRSSAIKHSSRRLAFVPPSQCPRDGRKRWEGARCIAGEGPTYCWVGPQYSDARGCVCRKS